jgi:5-methylthioribose kinase
MTRAESFIHGDLHIGSVMVSETATCVIDPEFAFYGPMAYDPAAVLSNLFLAYFAQQYHEAARGERPGRYRAWLLACARDLWTQFADKFLGLWRAQDALRQDGFVGRGIDEGAGAEAFRQAFMKQLFADTLGFAAAEMMRRVLGLAKVADITGIGDLALRAKVELDALRMAEKLAVERRGFGSIEEVVELAESLSPSVAKARPRGEGTRAPAADYLAPPSPRAWHH